MATSINDFYVPVSRPSIDVSPFMQQRPDIGDTIMKLAEMARRRKQDEQQMKMEQQKMDMLKAESDRKVAEQQKADMALIDQPAEIRARQREMMQFGRPLPTNRDAALALAEERGDLDTSNKTRMADIQAASVLNQISPQAGLNTINDSYWIRGTRPEVSKPKDVKFVGNASGGTHAVTLDPITGEMVGSSEVVPGRPEKEIFTGSPGQVFLQRQPDGSMKEVFSIPDRERVSGNGGGSSSNAANNISSKEFVEIGKNIRKMDSDISAATTNIARIKSGKGGSLIDALIAQNNPGLSGADDETKKQEAIAILEQGINENRAAIQDYSTAYPDMARIIPQLKKFSGKTPTPQGPQVPGGNGSLGSGKQALEDMRKKKQAIVPPISSPKTPTPSAVSEPAKTINKIYGPPTPDNIEPAPISVPGSWSAAWDSGKDAQRQKIIQAADDMGLDKPFYQDWETFINSLPKDKRWEIQKRISR